MTDEADEARARELAAWLNDAWQIRRAYVDRPGLVAHWRVSRDRYRELQAVDLVSGPGGITIRYPHDQRDRTPAVDLFGIRVLNAGHRHGADHIELVVHGRGAEEHR